MTRSVVILAVSLAAALALAPEVARAQDKPKTEDTKSEDKTKRVVTYKIDESLDISYGKAWFNNDLDVFAPIGEKGDRFPVVVFVHGGTWMFGDKDFFGIYRDVGKTLAKHGVVAVMINYRLSPVVRHPDHAKDVARAYAWTVKNIDKYGGDPDRIILAGHSAGGHLASLLACDVGYLRDKKLDLTDKQRESLKGVVSLSGVYRVPRPDEFHDMLGPLVRGMVGDSKDSRVARSVGPMLYAAGHSANPFPWIFGSDHRVVKHASPVFHVHKGMPPYLLLTAYREVPGLRAQAEEFEAALKKCEVDVTYKDLDDYTHHTLINRLHDGDTAECKLVLEFVTKHAGTLVKAK